MKEHFGIGREPEAGVRQVRRLLEHRHRHRPRARRVASSARPRPATILRDALAPFKDLGVGGATVTTSRDVGGTDSTSFNNAGLPGIGFGQDPIEYNSHTHHTNLDTYERIIEDDVKDVGRRRRGTLSISWRCATRCCRGSARVTCRRHRRRAPAGTERADGRWQMKTHASGRSFATRRPLSRKRLHVYRRLTNRRSSTDDEYCDGSILRRSWSARRPGRPALSRGSRQTVQQALQRPPGLRRARIHHCGGRRCGPGGGDGGPAGRGDERRALPRGIRLRSRCAGDHRRLADEAHLLRRRARRDRRRGRRHGGRDVQGAVRALGAVVPLGEYPAIGMGGHVAGGAFGFLCRQLGLAADYLYAVEVVTVDERRAAAVCRDARAVDDPNRDLWWAHTGGGGGNFGVVTRYWFRSPDAAGERSRRGCCRARRSRSRRSRRNGAGATSIERRSCGSSEPRALVRANSGADRRRVALDAARGPSQAVRKDRRPRREHGRGRRRAADRRTISPR